MSGSSPTLDIQVALLHSNLENMSKMLTDLKIVTDSLYTKVVVGNGQKPLITRLELLEMELHNAEKSHLSCQAPRKVEELQKTLHTVVDDLEDTNSKLLLFMDDDTFRKRKWFSMGVDLVRMFMYAIVAGGVAYIVSVNSSNRPSGYNQTAPERIVEVSR